MEVGLHANMYDQSTASVASALWPKFDALAARLNGDYGGPIEHLWIDFELIESHARSDGKPRFPFRFAKRVSGRSNFGLLAGPDIYNVGHYSVRPDFALITSLSEQQVVQYALSLIYDSTAILLGKRKGLAGFDAVAFRSKFLVGCKMIGHELPGPP